MAYKSGFVVIVGRPNVGKSTLLNKIIGQKVVITSDKPQTTRKRIRGIYTSDRGQIVFIDTPGVHKPLHKLGEFLLEETKLAIPDTDLVIFMVNGTETAGPGDKWIVDNLFKAEMTIIMVVNKVDQLKSLTKRDEIIETYKKLFKERTVPIIKISAMTGRNVDDLIKNIYRKLPSGPQYYPDDDVTDQNIRSIIEETIREKILINTQEEIPHSVAVVIDCYEDKENIVNIAATIFIERDSQKGIIIGKQGSMLKKVGSLARIEIEKLVEKKVFLELFVKIKKDWRKKDASLKGLGYKSQT